MEQENVSINQCDIYFSYDDIVLYSYPKPLQIFITIVIPIITFIGLGSNGMFLYVVSRLPEMRTITNIYLSNLAISDCFVLICGVIQYLYSYYQVPINVGFAFETGVGCALAGVIGYGCYFNSVFIVTLVMFERYMAICYPFHHRKIASKGRVFKLIIACWILSFLLSLWAAGNNSTVSFCLDWGDHTSNNNPEIIHVCSQAAPWILITLYMTDFIQFTLSLCVNIFFMINIILTLTQRMPSASTEDKRATVEKNQIALMLIINAIIFFFCLGPYQILNFEYAYVHFKDTFLFKRGNVPYILSYVGQATTLLNSSINPIIYGITNRRYRYAFQKAVCVQQGRVHQRKHPEQRVRQQLIRTFDYYHD